MRACRRVGGGSISDTRRYETDGGPIFVKVADAGACDMLEAEAAGLDALAQTHSIRTPRVLAAGLAAGRAFLALEWIELRSADRAAEATFGEQLARLHHATEAWFGWFRDNTIGSTPQLNTPMDDWVAFFRERRLRFQLRLAAASGGASLLARGERLCESLHCFFVGYRPVPALLHGDLWSGNWGVDTQGAPVVFDPAVYYGDREADIAMTHLFGGFGPAFHAAYQDAWPLAAGADVRMTLYNLYHVLNHYNLFGGGYFEQAGAMIDRLLAEVRS
ncbi:MAG TPA: fructosamine kinase family protein [Steroidobacter sp.]|nr:fructosamine kinase family protein [Steroidobacter sp.]